MSSDAHKGASLNFADLQLEQGYVSHRAYGQSKLALVVFTYELARRLEGSGVTVNAVHPGFVASDIYRKAGWLLRVIAPLLRLFAAKPAKGARSSVFLASAPEVAGASGGYYIDCRPAESSPVSRDPKSAERLWRISAAMTGL